MSAGVGVPNSSAGTGVAEIHTEDATTMDPTAGTPMRQQVVQVEAKRGVARMIELLERIDARLAALEENANGFSTS